MPRKSEQGAAAAAARKSDQSSAKFALIEEPSAKDAESGSAAEATPDATTTTTNTSPAAAKATPHAERTTTSKSPVAVTKSSKAAAAATGGSASGSAGASAAAPAAKEGGGGGHPQTSVKDAVSIEVCRGYFLGGIGLALTSICAAFFADFSATVPLFTRTGPRSTKINYHTSGKGCAAVQYTDSGQCSPGNDQERHGVYQPSGGGVSPIGFSEGRDVYLCFKANGA